MHDIDLSFIDSRNNRILATGAHPSILLDNLRTVILNKVVEEYPITACSILVLYNKYRGRSSSLGTIGMSHVIAAMAKTEDDLNELLTLNDDEITRLAPSETIIRGLMGRDIVIHGTPMLAIHQYVEARSRDGSIPGIFSALKSSLSIRGRPLTTRAIIGGIAYGVGSGISQSALYNRLSSLEQPTNQRMTMNEFADAITWYKGQVDIEPMDRSFYRRAMEDIQKIPIIDIDVYEPQLDSQNLIIVPNQAIDPIDTISSTRTSRDIPAMIANIRDKKTIKIYDNVEKQIPWFYQVRPNTMRIITRVTRFPDRYQDVVYNMMRNQIHISTRSRYIPIPEVMNSICTSTGLRTLPIPTLSSSVFVFMTNYISGGTGAIGIDRNVMAWLITNPPPEYKKTNIHKYIFLREDTEPNSLKEHVSIHIQLGADKMFLSFSKQGTTSGTIIEDEGDMVSFVPGQEFIMVRINSCPSIHHARVCQHLYLHLISMYIKYYAEVRDKILKLGIEMEDNPPVIHSLVSIPTSPHHNLIHRDPILFKYTSSIPIDRLPVPISRNEIEKWRRDGYGVIMVPTTVRNNVHVRFEAASNIWLRTPNRGMAWSLHRKNNGKYIPLPSSGSYEGDLPVRVNRDWTLTELHDSGSGTRYILKDTNSLVTKMMRYAYATDTMSMFLRPVVGTGTVVRHAISGNMFYNMNYITNKDIPISKVAEYAYLCKQSCYDQDISAIKDDILSMSIDPMRHHRAIEQAFQINIYYVMEDPIEPYMIKPRHAFFYLHNYANRSWPTVIMHTMPDAGGFFTVIAKESSHLFTTTDYMDSKIEEVNVTRMISPESNNTEIVRPSTVINNIGMWQATEQILDSYGKVRAINYKNGDHWVTISIGFSSIKLMPIGHIKKPSERFISNISSFTGIYKDIGDLILSPDNEGAFSIWKDTERSARILRVVAHLLYSQEEDVHIDDFMEQIEIDPDIDIYDTSGITHTLPEVEDAWEYFGSIIPSMVDEEDRVILVPDEETRDALRNHIMATPKILWPSTFPGYVRYTWDIESSDGESVFMSDEDLLQALILERNPTVTRSMHTSTMAYLLNAENRLFLVQMANDRDHASYIIWMWITQVTNPGYDATNASAKDVYMPEFSIENMRKMESPGIIIWSDRTFAIMPLL